MNKKLLTIGIPTYNGERYLEHCLDSIFDQLSCFDRKNIEVFVSDNASSDKTFEIISKYISMYPDIIVYHKNKENVGYDKNISLIFEKAQGDYVALLGDDDFLDKKALCKLMFLLEERPNLSVVLLGVNFVDSRLVHSTSKINEKCNSLRRLFFNSGDAFFKNSLWKSSPLSSLVIKRSDWLRVFSPTFWGSNWVHIEGILNVLKKNELSCMASDIIVNVRVYNERWGSNFGNQLMCGLNQLYVFEKMIGLGYQKDTFNLFLRSRFSNNLKDIIILSPPSWSDKVKAFMAMQHFFKFKPAFWLFHVPMLFLFPKNTVHKFYIFFKNIVIK